MKLFFLPLVFYFYTNSSLADKAYEKKLNYIYTYKYPLLSEKEWDTLLNQAQASEEYIIQKNDTLWDISRVLFGTGFYWPKIWSFNARITNPHQIFPGKKLIFSFGSLTTTPKVEVKVSKDTPSQNKDSTSSVIEEPTEIKKRALPPFSEKIEDVIPDPLYPYKPLLTKLPPSLADLQIIKEPQEEDLELKGYYSESLKRDNYKILSYYVLNYPPKGIGRLIENENSMKLSSPQNKVLVRLKNKNEYESGKILLILKNQGPLSKINKFIFSSRPYSITLSGTLKILEKIQKGSFYDIYEAEVVQSFQPIEFTDIVVTDSIEKIKIPKNLDQVAPAVTKKYKSQIIGGAPTLNKRFHEVNSFVYINAGYLDGLKKGDVLKVKENEELRKTESRYRNQRRVIGKVQIVHVDDRFSTALVLTVPKGYLLSGDYIP